MSLFIEFEQFISDREYLKVSASHGLEKHIESCKVIAAPGHDFQHVIWQNLPLSFHRKLKNIDRLIEIWLLDQAIIDDKVDRNFVFSFDGHPLAALLHFYNQSTHWAVDISGK